MLPSSLLPLLPLLLASAAALYIYDDAPAFGYVAVDGAARKMPAHKKYYIGGGAQKNKKLVNERAVDAYFRVLRRPAPRRTRSQPPRSQPPSPAQARKRGAGWHAEPRSPPYALFYRTNPELEQPAELDADGRAAVDEPQGAAAYYRGSASNHVDIHSGRRAAKTIGAADDTVNQFNTL